MRALFLVLPAVLQLVALHGVAAAPAPLDVPLAPGVVLALAPAGEGDGAFLVSRRPVSRAQFQAFFNATGYKTEAERGTSGGFGYDPATKNVVQRAGYSWKNPGFEQAPDDPVTGVTRDDALAFLAWASRQARRSLTLPSVRRWEIAVAAYPLPRPAGPGTSVREWTLDDAVQPAGQPPRVVLRGASWLQDAGKPDPTQLSNAASPGSRRPDFGFRAVADPAAASSPPPAVTAAPTPTAQPGAAAAGNWPDPAAAKVSVAPAAESLPTPENTSGSLVKLLLLVIIGLPVLVVVALIIAAIKAFSGAKPIVAKVSTAFAPGDNTGSTQRATAVRGGIQIRANVPWGTPVSVTWAGGPPEGMTLPYEPGPQGMFLPVGDNVRDPRLTIGSGQNSLVPGAALVPVDGGFQVKAAVPDGTTIHAAWTDDQGQNQTGSARYDGVNGHAFFRTSRRPGRIAISLQPISNGGNLSTVPPAGATSLRTDGSAPIIHSYQDHDNFWTGFWLSDILSSHSATPYPRPGHTDIQTSLDDGQRTPPVPNRGEPSAYH